MIFWVCRWLPIVALPIIRIAGTSNVYSSYPNNLTNSFYRPASKINWTLCSYDLIL